MHVSESNLKLFQNTPVKGISTPNANYDNMHVSKDISNSFHDWNNIHTKDILRLFRIQDTFSFWNNIRHKRYLKVNPDSKHVCISKDISRSFWNRLSLANKHLNLETKFPYQGTFQSLFGNRISSTYQTLTTIEQLGQLKFFPII